MRANTQLRVKIGWKRCDKKRQDKPFTTLNLPKGYILGDKRSIRIDSNV